MINNILGTLSLARDIQIDKAGQINLENMSKLEALVDQISLPVLFSSKSPDTLSIERKALFHYMSNIREAVASTKIGYDEYAKQALKDGITPEFIRSIQLLDNNWNCKPQRETPQTGAVILAENVFKTGVALPTVKNTPIKPMIRAAIGNPGAHSRLKNNNLSKRTNFSFHGILKQDKALMITTAFFAFSALIYLGQKRSKNFKVRETRRFLHELVNIRIGKVNCAIVIVDISMNGLKIQHEGVINRQHKLRIQLGGVWYPAHIKWSNQRFAGVKFERPISKKIFKSIVQSSQLG